MRRSTRVPRCATSSDCHKPNPASHASSQRLQLQPTQHRTHPLMPAVQIVELLPSPTHCCPELPPARAQTTVLQLGHRHVQQAAPVAVARLPELVGDGRRRPLLEGPCLTHVRRPPNHEVAAPGTGCERVNRRARGLSRLRPGQPRPQQGAVRDARQDRPHPAGTPRSDLLVVRVYVHALQPLPPPSRKPPVRQP